MKRVMPQKWVLASKVALVVAVVLMVKHFVHLLGIEQLNVNSLFGAIISSNVFLIGFLISGVLTDYKEAEKLPDEMVANLEALSDDALSLLDNPKNRKYFKDFYKLISKIASQAYSWFYKEVRTASLLKSIDELNSFFASIEGVVAPNYIIRMKQEQNSLRRIVKRIRTIRETSFNPSGYAVAEIITFFLVVGMVFTNIEPYLEGMFLIGFVTFMLIYMILLIKDFDNPFGYYDHRTFAEDVSLTHIEELAQRLKSKAEKH